MEGVRKIEVGSREEAGRNMKQGGGRKQKARTETRWREAVSRMEVGSREEEARRK